MDGSLQNADANRMTYVYKSIYNPLRWIYVNRKSPPPP